MHTSRAEPAELSYYFGELLAAFGMYAARREAPAMPAQALGRKYFPIKEFNTVKGLYIDTNIYMHYAHNNNKNKGRAKWVPNPLLQQK